MHNLRIISSKKVSSKTKQEVNAAYKGCVDFFEYDDIGSFLVVLCHTKQEFKKESRYYYVPYATALVLRNKNIITKSPELIKSEKRWSEKDFVNILAHEMAHSFWYSMLKVWTPNWLSEGIACNIGKQFFLSKKEMKKLLQKDHVDFSFIDFRYLPKKLGTHTIDRYKVWSNFTRYLLKSYGKKKVLLILKKYAKNKNKSNYESLFISIYKKSVRQMFKEYIDSL